MSFYDNASIVMIPSGYKAGKLYSAKPTNGDADFVYTRTGATASRVNESGLVERCRTNQAIYSNQINDASWARSNVTVSADTIANPIDGIVNADTIILSSGTTQKYIGISNSLNGFYTYSFYLKYISHQFIQVFAGIDAGFYCNFDLQNKTLSASACTGSISDIGNGWIRCSLSFTSTTGSGLYFLAVDSLSSFRFTATSSTGSFYAFGAQLEIGDIATAYIPTTSAAVTVGPIANVPRLDYTGGGCPKLLMEPTRTNRSIYSEQFNNAAYTLQAGTLTANNTTSPDGYQNADLFLETSATSSHSIGCPIITTGLYTAAQSVFVKNAPNGRGFVQLTGAAIWNGTGNNFYVNFDIINGTVTASNGATGSIISYGNGWFRCIAVSTCIIEYEDRLRIRSITNGAAAYAQSFAGDITKGFYVYGSTFEQGAYATSYIPTFNASVTRIFEQSNKSSISSLIGQTEGTLYWEINKLLNHFWYLSLSSGSTSNWILVGLDNNKAIGYIRNSNIEQANILSGVLANGKHKMAISYSSNYAALFVDGVKIGQDLIVTIPACNRIDITGSEVNVPQSDSGEINQILVFKNRLSDADCITLTTL